MPGSGSSTLSLTINGVSMLSGSVEASGGNGGAIVSGTAAVGAAGTATDDLTSNTTGALSATSTANYNTGQGVGDGGSISTGTGGMGGEGTATSEASGTAASGVTAQSTGYGATGGSATTLGTGGAGGTGIASSTGSDGGAATVTVSTYSQGGLGGQGTGNGFAGALAGPHSWARPRELQPEPEPSTLPGRSMAATEALEAAARMAATE